MWKIHANEIRVKLRHTGEDRICTTVKHLHYSVKGALEVCEDYATAKIKQKFLCKVEEECNLKPDEMIYLYLSSHEKSSHGGSKNWILIQDLDKIWSFFTKAKEGLPGKTTIF